MDILYYIAVAVVWSGRSPAHFAVATAVIAATFTWGLSFLGRLTKR